MTESHLGEGSNTELHQLLEKYFNNSDKFIIIAYILVDPLLLRSSPLFESDGWTVVSGSNGAQYVKEFSRSSTADEWINSISSLNKILLSYFICEGVPRKIQGFIIPKYLPSEMKQQLSYIFGSRITEKEIQNSFWLGGELSGFLANGWVGEGRANTTELSSLQEWFTIFNHQNTFYCINLIKEAFIVINRQINKHKYFDVLDICTAIILLVSALEGIFTFGQENNSDIKFKFTTIGLIYYKKNVTDNFFDRYESLIKISKMSNPDFKTLLSTLYNLRCDIAHGNYKAFQSEKEWNKILKLMYIWPEKLSNQAVRANYMALCLGFLQKHILALIVQSKEDLHKGINIIDDVLLHIT